VRLILLGVELSYFVCVETGLLNCSNWNRVPRSEDRLPDPRQFGELYFMRSAVFWAFRWIESLIALP
jgi:hypothetical protein